MIEYQRLFLVQARSTFRVFELLCESNMPACHCLHQFQMATELLAKAHSWKNNFPNTTSHKAFVGFLRSLSTNRKAQKQLGFDGKNDSWNQMIEKSLDLAQQAEYLAPALAQDGPNPEYPWPRNTPTTAPVEHNFELWEKLRDTAAGRKFLKLVAQLFASAEEFL